MVSEVSVRVSVIKITNYKTQIPNNWLLILFDIFILRFGIYLSFGFCNLLFLVYMGEASTVPILALTTALQGPLFPSVVSE